LNSNGMILRFVHNNEIMQDIASRLNLLAAQDICVITHFGEGQEEQDKLGPVKDNIERRLAEFCQQKPGRTRNNVKYIVVVTGRCRMGENLPNDCNIIASLGIGKNTHLSTMLQDVGRVFGYKPGAYILTTDIGAQRLREYQNLKYDGPVHPNVAMERRRNCRAFYPHEHPKIKALCKSLEKELKVQKHFGRQKAYDRLFEPCKSVFQNLAKNDGDKLLAFAPGELYLTLRTRKADNSDKKGGKKTEGIIIRMEEHSGRIESIDWPLVLPSRPKMKAKGGVSSKLRTAA
jgi:hypothetical protein